MGRGEHSGGEGRRGRNWAVDNLLGSDAFSSVMCGGVGRARGSLPGGTFNLER